MKFIKTKYQRTTFSCIEELVDDMVETIIEAKDEYTTVTVIAKAETMLKVFRELAITEINGFEVDFAVIGIDTEEYDDLYYLSLSKDGKLWVEKAWHEDNQWHKAGYLYNESELTYLFNYDANNEIMEAIEGNNVLIFDIED